MLQITNEDNMSLMSRYPDGYFDLAIIDPEYGLNADKPSIKNSSVKQKNGARIPIANDKYEHKNWDTKPAGPEFFRELKRVSKHQIVFGVNYFDFDFRGGRIVWDRLNGESDQFGCEIAYNSLNNRTDIVYFLWSGMMQGVYCGKDVRKALIQQGNKKLNEKRIHPTQKPVALYGYILTENAQPGWKILDTGTGSGSLPISCHDYGYDLVGCEKDKDIFDRSMVRINQHISQVSIFDVINQLTVL